MDAPTATIIGVSATAVVTIAGWNISHILAKRREDHTRRLEATQKHIERQIEEFYGPLLNLIEQVFNVWAVREKIIQQNGSSTLPPGKNKQNNEIRYYVQENYFFPLHEKIRELLTEKLYLTDGGHIPESFRAYLEHSTQQIVQKALEKELNLDMRNVPILPWPDSFYQDVKATLESLMERYDQCIQDFYPDGVYGIGKAKPRKGSNA
jgi:hypothetical protein